MITEQHLPSPFTFERREPFFNPPKVVGVATMISQELTDPLRSEGLVVLGFDELDLFSVVVSISLPFAILRSKSPGT